MSGGTGSTLESIDAVDAFASTLFLRASNSSDSSLFDVAATVRQLHIALRHVRIEAADPDSLLNSAADASLYARQLRPIVEDCGFALKQLEIVLDKYGPGAVARLDADATKDRDERIAAIRSKLANERISVEMFLDTVQLHSPIHMPSGCAYEASSQSSLDSIKDKVDAIAQRLFNRRDSGFSDERDEDDLWQQFKVELEHEGFSPDVLHKHKDVLRAYIRELESMLCMNGGPTPTVRGLLEYESKSTPTTPTPRDYGAPPFDDQRLNPAMNNENRDTPRDPPPPLPRRPRPYHHDGHSSGSSDGGTDTSGDSLAVISTRDLMALDTVTSGMANMHLQPHQQYQPGYGSPIPRSSPKYLPSNVAGTLPPPSEAELSSSPNSQLLGMSPRSSGMLPQYASPQSTAPIHDGMQQRAPRLGPDRYGKEIPVDAQWTKIKRTIVSPVVLERAGVRYEARPDYVAVLGRLSREEVAEYARQSAEVRAARNGRSAMPPPPVPPKVPEKQGRDRADSKSSRDEEDEGSVLWDESDTTDYDDDKTSEKGTRSYPYIVNPPEKTSPNSATQPKPILKNKNENHVRFDPEPHEVDSRSPRRDETRSSPNRRPRDSTTRRRRDSHRDSRTYSDSNRRSGGDPRRDRDRERDRDRDRDYYRSSHYRDSKTDRRDKKKAWGETLGAVGIGGAAASLISVLAEAAGHMS